MMGELYNGYRYGLSVQCKGALGLLSRTAVTIQSPNTSQHITVETIPLSALVCIRGSI